MKKFIFIILISLFTSCSVTREFYQIGTLCSDLPTSDNGGYKYVDEACEILYDFWDEGGAVCFSVYNNTDEVLYIDMANSYLIKNGIAYDYFSNSVVTISSLNGTKSYTEKMVLGIPPKSAKIFNEFSIMESRYQDCDLYESPSKNEQSMCSFTLDSAPVFLTNYISYRVGKNGANTVIKNSFYLSEVKNHHYDDVVLVQEVGCSTDKYGSNQYVFAQRSPKSFYITYLPREQKKSKMKMIIQKDGTHAKGDDVKKTTSVKVVKHNATTPKSEGDMERDLDWDIERYEVE